jgi:hypothetical protein
LRRLRNEIKVRKVRVNFDRQAIAHERRLSPAAPIIQHGFPRCRPCNGARLFVDRRSRFSICVRCSPSAIIIPTEEQENDDNDFEDEQPHSKKTQRRKQRQQQIKKRGLTRRGYRSPSIHTGRY